MSHNYCVNVIDLAKLKVGRSNSAMRSEIDNGVDKVSLPSDTHPPNGVLTGK